LEALLTSIFLVAIAEIGDKTQLLSFVLAARLRKPWPIIGGILLATLANHALAGWVGSLLAGWVPPTTLGWIGEKLALKIPLKAVRIVAAALFMAVGALTLWSASLPIQ
jgi:putative Ca2+/H+ antiporter (TMEM165/GDT1 family)